MREILFRGQRKEGRLKGQWVEGDLAQSQHYEIFHGENRQWGCLVISETVGQYTGLKDTNGVKIFEGDILEYVNGDGTKAHYVVEMCVDEGVWLAKWVEGDGHSSAKCISLMTVIVGNIHDNPELLEVGGDG